MNDIPLICSDRSLCIQIIDYAATDNIVILESEQQAIDYLNLEMPELMIVNFLDDKIDGFTLLNTILHDPWLLNGGIIALCDDSIASRIEGGKESNLIIALHPEEISEHLAQVLTIIENNRRILFQRVLGADLVSNISGSFKLKNDPIECKCYVNLICNFLYNCDRLDRDKKYNLQLALHEMLTNAAEHGNCEIDYDEKSEWLDKHDNIELLVKEKLKDPTIANRRVTFEYSITSRCAKFLIADEGSGFNWRDTKDVTKGENIFELHGRGILMTKSLVQNLTYNEKGNEVRFEIAYETKKENSTPALFKQIKPRDVKKGEIIFREGDPSDFLYYIVKGLYHVTVNEKIVSILTPDDIFMGEMSFLLNNKRSATIRAESDGRLVRVSKRKFVEAIKRSPHYVLFLSRLLARRIERLNRSR